MTHRERFRTVLARRTPDRIPFVARLDLWHNAAKSDGTLPPECRDLLIPQIEDRLRMGRSARFNDFADLAWDGVQIAQAQDGTREETTFSAHGHTLRQVMLRTPEQSRAGIRGHVVEYFLKTREDYAAFARMWEGARWTARHEAFESFSREIGDDGLPMIVIGPGPIHRIMIEYAGYENFYLHLADFPDAVEALLRVMERRFEELWPELARSSAEIVLHGAHWSTEMTPRPMFRKYFLPYFERCTDAMHRAGKSCAFHGDADLSGLTAEVLASGMDVADCFACAPLVKLGLGEARRVRGDRVILWGGIPSTIFLASCPEREFRNVLDRFLQEVSDGRAVIAGISDNLMPGSDSMRLKQTAEAIAGLRVRSA